VFNPMLGFPRRAGSASSIPKSPRMQARAVLEAARRLREGGYQGQAEIMIPLVGSSGNWIAGRHRPRNGGAGSGRKKKVKLTYRRRHDDRDSARRVDRR